MKTTFLVVVAIFLLLVSVQITDSKKDDKKDSLEGEDKAKRKKDESLHVEESKGDSVLAAKTKDELQVEGSEKDSVKIDSNQKDNLEGQETRRIDPPHPAPEPYQFSFETKDPKAGEQFRQEDGNKDGVVRGSYGFRTPEGVFRVVDYIADSLGFRANIHSNEPGLAKQAPTDITIGKSGGKAIVEAIPKAPLLPPPLPPPAPVLDIEAQKGPTVDSGIDFGTQFAYSPPREKFVSDNQDGPPPPPPLSSLPKNLPPPPTIIHTPSVPFDGPKDLRTFGTVGVDIPPGPPPSFSVKDSFPGSEGKDTSGNFDLPPRVTVIHHETSYEKFPEPIVSKGIGIGELGKTYVKPIPVDVPPYRDEILEKKVPPPLVKAYDDEIVSVKQPPSTFRQKFVPPPLPPPPPPRDYVEEQIPVKSAPLPPPPPPIYQAKDYSGAGDFDIPPRVTVIHHDANIDTFSKPVLQKDIPTIGVVKGKSWLPPRGNYEDFSTKEVSPPSGQYDLEKPPLLEGKYEEGAIGTKLPLASFGKDGPQKILPDDLDIPPRVTIIHHDSEYNRFNDPKLPKDGITTFDVPKQQAISPFSDGTVLGKQVPEKGYAGDTFTDGNPPLLLPDYGGEKFPEKSLPPVSVGKGYGGELDIPPPPDYGGEKFPEKSLPPVSVGKGYIKELDVPPRVTVIHHGGSGVLGSLKDGPPLRDFGDKDARAKGLPGSSIVEYESDKFPLLQKEYGRPLAPNVPCPPFPHLHEQQRDYPPRGYHGEDGGKFLPPNFDGKGFDKDRDLPPRVSVIHHDERYNKIISPATYNINPLLDAQKDKEILPLGGNGDEPRENKGTSYGGYYNLPESLPPPPPPPSDDKGKYIDIKGAPPPDYAIPLPPPRGNTDVEVVKKPFPPYSGPGGADREIIPPPPPPFKHQVKDFFVKDPNIPPRITIIHHDVGYNKGPGKSVTTLRYSRYNNKDIVHPEFNYGGYRDRPLNYHIPEERPVHHYGGRHFYPFRYGGPRLIAIGLLDKNYRDRPFDRYNKPYHPGPYSDGVKSIHRDIPREPPRIIKVLRPYKSSFGKPKGLKLIAIKSPEINGPGPEVITPKAKVVNVVSLLVALRPEKCPTVCG